MGYSNGYDSGWDDAIRSLRADPMADPVIARFVEAKVAEIRADLLKPEITALRAYDQSTDVIIRDYPFYAAGRNLSFVDGDSVEVSWVNGGVRVTETLAPSSVMGCRFEFDFPDFLSWVTDGVELTFKFSIAGTVLVRNVIIVAEGG